MTPGYVGVTLILRISGKSYEFLEPLTGIPTKKPKAEDSHGHGTHIAGILVGGCNSGTQIGGAPQAGIRVVGFETPPYNRSWYTHFLRAAERLYTSAPPTAGVKLINVSLGILAQQVSRWDKVLFESVVQQTQRQTVLFVAAIGNTRGLSSSPACVDGVLSAGAYQPDLQNWRNSGKRPDLILPGTGVCSCWPLDGPASEAGVRYVFDDGTSQATAHLTALAALLMEAFDSVAPWEIAEALKKTADQRRRPDLLAAYQRLAAPSRTRP